MRQVHDEVSWAHACTLSLMTWAVVCGAQVLPGYDPDRTLVPLCVVAREAMKLLVADGSAVRLERPWRGCSRSCPTVRQHDETVAAGAGKKC